MAPIFFVVFSIPMWTGKLHLLSSIIMIVMFAVMELTDLLDGIIARKYNLVTDMGKVLDPFADVISRMTYFVCISSAGVMPAWMLLVLFYRELSITFVRLYLIKKGYTMAASVWGKLKAVSYTVSGVLGLFVIIAARMNLLQQHSNTFQTIATISFVVSVVMAVVSFITYIAKIQRH